MSNPYLPRETLDYIVDLLHDQPETLKECCLVSKPWIPRTRKHLFATIEFISIKDLESWKKTFPDPPNSPGCHTRTLFFRCARVVTAAGTGAGGLIQTFSQVVRLELSASDAKPLVMFGTLEKTSLAPFHNFSPTLKSLRVDSVVLQCPQVFDLVCSFPLLEDLTLLGDDQPLDDDNDSHGPRTVVPSTSPPLTGSLELTMLLGMGNVTRRLLDLPNGLHFRELVFWWFYEMDLSSMMELVARCSDTLECLDVRCYPPGTFAPVLLRGCNPPSFVGDRNPASIDLSKATKLKDVVFRPGSLTVKWVIMALQTIASKCQDPPQVSLHVPYSSTLVGASPNVRQSVGERDFGQWLELDRLLVQLWESHSVCPKIICTTPKGGKEKEDVRGYIERLLPEITKEVIIDLVEHNGAQ